MALNTLELTALIGLGALVAGFLGALTGLGGGVVIVPLLTVVFHVDIHYAIGAALVSVIATSSGAAAAYVREGYSNVRVGMFLEIATTVGALVGAALILHLRVSIISIIFGVVLLYSAYASMTEHTHSDANDGPDRIATWLAMDRAMKLPFKVSTTTSNFMIGVTAAAGAGVYLRRGYVDPGLAMPVMLG